MATGEPRAIDRQMQMASRTKRIWVGVFGICMMIPTTTWGLLAQSERGSSPLLGSIALTGSFLAGLSTAGALMMRSWTAYAFAGWALISVAWESGLQAAVGSLSPSRVMASVVGLGLMWALAAVLYRQIARYEQEHPRSQTESTMW
jgi:hypothetical protein